jgi:hypothetical protein
MKNNKAVSKHEHCEKDAENTNKEIWDAAAFYSARQVA